MSDILVELNAPVVRVNMGFGSSESKAYAEQAAESAATAAEIAESVATLAEAKEYLGVS